jgi:hypothetical protein
MWEDKGPEHVLELTTIRLSVTEVSSEYRYAVKFKDPFIAPDGARQSHGGVEKTLEAAKEAAQQTAMKLLKPQVFMNRDYEMLIPAPPISLGPGYEDL